MNSKDAMTAMGFAIGTVFALFCWWLAGFNFDHRGGEALGVFLTTALSGIGGAIFGRSYPNV